MHCLHCEKEFNQHAAQSRMEIFNLSQNDLWRDCIDCPLLDVCPGRCDDVLPK
jgi:radical SAM protein with 4Fe4S-binding SPASM domain